MSGDVAASFYDASPMGRPRAWETMVYGGLAAGVLDFFDAVVFNALRGTSAVRVWQFVASGLLGRAAFNGGMKTALLGVLLHFMIAFILAAIYYVACRLWPTLLRRSEWWGIIYGVAVYVVMNFVVLPLSAAPPLGFKLSPALNGVIGHALLVGLPIALAARWSAKKSQRISGV